MSVFFVKANTDEPAQNLRGFISLWFLKRKRGLSAVFGKAAKFKIQSGVDVQFGVGDRFINATVWGYVPLFSKPR